MCAQEAVKSGILDFNKQHSIIDERLVHPRELLADDPGHAASTRSGRCS